MRQGFRIFTGAVILGMAGCGGVVESLEQAAQDAANQIADGLTVCGVGGETSEDAARAAMIGACAGSYEVETVHSGAHVRGTVVVGTDNSVDFDEGTILDAAAAADAEVYDRIRCCNRLDVDYADGSRLQFYYDAENRTLRNARLDDIRVGFLAPLPAGSAEAGTADDNRIQATVAGESRVEELEPGPGTGSFFTSVGDRFSIGGDVWSISNIPAETGVHECEPLPMGTGIGYLKIQDEGAGEAGGEDAAVGRCTIEILSLDTNSFGKPVAVEGTFAVELLSRGQDGEGRGVLLEIVADGYFRAADE